MLRRNRSRGPSPRRNNNNSHSNNSRSHGSGVYERPESRPRFGVASQNYERFMNQAKDALSSGDRVQAEFYYQHADHYLRILNEYRDQQKTQQSQVSSESPSDQALPQADTAQVQQIMPSPTDVESKPPVAEAVNSEVKSPARRQSRKPKPQVDSNSPELESKKMQASES